MNDAGGPETLPDTREKDAAERVTLRGVLSLLPGLLIITMLAAYAVVHALPKDAPKAAVIGSPGQVAKATPASQGVLIGNKVFYPPANGPTPLVVHLACNQDDARLARIYDPPPSGSAIVLRLDQSLDEMRLLVAGKDPQFPRDARLVTTPCMQAMIEHGEFP